jgi:hypothetical protein
MSLTAYWTNFGHSKSENYSSNHWFILCAKSVFPGLALGIVNTWHERNPIPACELLDDAEQRHGKVSFLEWKIVKKDYKITCTICYTLFHTEMNK